MYNESQNFGSPEEINPNYGNLNASPQKSQFPQEVAESQVHPRISYLRKLYSLLFVQLTLVAIVTYCSWSNADFKKILKENPVIFYISLILVIVLAIFVLIARRLSERTPINWIVYLVFTIALCFVFAYFVSIGNSDVALMIFLMADAIVLSLLIYVLTTKIELTYQGASLFVLGGILLTFQLFLIFTETEFDYMVYVAMGEAIFAFFLMYQTQTIISGSPADYNGDWVSAAVREYSQVIVLFLKVCELVRQVIIRERN